MRYESLPRKIINAIRDTFKFMHNEFGNWAYVILAFLVLLTYKFVLKSLALASQIVLYGFIIIFLLVFGHKIFKKFIK